MSRIVYVLNGPNLNLLGKREPHIYGHSTLSDVEADCRKVAKELTLDIEFRQSNREYELIDWVQEARERAGGIVIKQGPDGTCQLETVAADTQCQHGFRFCGWFPLPAKELEVNSGSDRERRQNSPLVCLGLAARTGPR